MKLMIIQFYSYLNRMVSSLLFSFPFFTLELRSMPVDEVVDYDGDDDVAVGKICVVVYPGVVGWCSSFMLYIYSD